jgi:hypothetical protein
LETTDEERTVLAASLGQSQMVSRKQVTQLVTDYIDRLKSGLISDEAEIESEKETAAIVARTVERSEDHNIRPFVPSRGDEPYLCKPESRELAAVCSQVLDGLEFIEAFTWETVERNRK